MTTPESVYLEAGKAMVPFGDEEERLFEWHHCVDQPACHGATGPCACSGIPWPSAAVRAAVDRAYTAGYGQGRDDEAAGPLLASYDPVALRAAATGGGPCRCGKPFYTHVCLGCSPDSQTPGPGCHNCRQTGMDQTPCVAMIDGLPVCRKALPPDPSRCPTRWDNGQAPRHICLQPVGHDRITCRCACGSTATLIGSQDGGTDG